MTTSNKPSGFKQYTALIVAVIMLIAVSIFAVNSLKSNEPSVTPIATDETTNTEPTSQDETPSKSYIAYTATSDGSALDQLEAINDTVAIKESELGKYVEGINGLIGGTNGKYWSFYVDDKLAEVGADSYKLEGGEKIEWKFQKL